MEKIKTNGDTILKNIEDKDEDKFRMYATIAFMVVVIIVGVPMWWKTTTVYRVSLPSNNILSLSDKPIKTAVKIGIFTYHSDRSKQLIKELREAFENNDLWIMTFEQITTSKNVNEFKTPVGLETMLLAENKQEAGGFLFIEWPKLQEEVIMNTGRTAFIRSDTSASKLKLVLNALVLQTHRVQQILTKDARLGTKSEAPQAEYDVIVSVFNPVPEIMDAKWNVPMAVNTYLAPFLEHVSNISIYTLKTQWIYTVEFEAELKQIRDSSKIGRHYALQQSALPHIITALEKYVGVGISAKSTINLVVYIPPCNIAPIHIYNNMGEMATNQNVDAFISPKWGGVIIANPPEDACLQFNESQERVQFYVETNNVMQIMLYQMHKLLDISSELTIDGVKTVVLEQIAPRLWEYEAYIRRSAIMHIATATNTLQSLVKLLDEISYIVINDDVGNDILDSYAHILRAKSALAANQLGNASAYAKHAFLASERCFFDSSLLAQLYFPDEQKYAIYIPLFLPIMVPVITSFWMLRRLLSKFKKDKKLKSN